MLPTRRDVAMKARGTGTMPERWPRTFPALGMRAGCVAPPSGTTRFRTSTVDGTAPVAERHRQHRRGPRASTNRDFCTFSPMKASFSETIAGAKKCALPVSSPSLRDHRQMRPYGDDVRMSEAGPERLPTARGAATRPYGFMAPTTRSFGSSPRLECGRALRRRSNRSEDSRFRIFSSSDPVWLAY